jgi:hypothetical protein
MASHEARDTNSGYQPAGHHLDQGAISKDGSCLFSGRTIDMKKTFAQTLTSPDLIAKAATAGVSMVIAENFYKLGSFSLECVAFLATWGLLYGACSLAFGFHKSSGPQA